MLHTGELSYSEKKFRRKRSQKTMEAIQGLLGEKGPKSLDETPTIALAISGGGYRAVSASCGAIEALMENRLFDTLMYCAGLSGSVWYMSSAYSTKWLHSKDVEEVKKHHDWIRDQLAKEIKVNVWTTIKYVFKAMFTKRKAALSDMLGFALRDILLHKENKNATLSSLQRYVEDGNVPLPIFSVAHVRNNYPVPDFWEEVELSPFEATYSSYRIIVPIEHINSVWKKGRLHKSRDEPTLHYIMGFCGCAFAILLYHIEELNELDAKRTFRNSWDEMVRGLWDAVINFASGVFTPRPDDHSHERLELRHSSEVMAAPEMRESDITALTDVEETGTGVADEISAISERNFKTAIWDPFLAEAMEEEGVEINFDDAYSMYASFKRNEDNFWIDDLLDLEVGKDDKEFEGLGRNIGPIKRTGFLRNPLYGMSDTIQKYMMNDQSVHFKKPDATKRIGERASTRLKEILVVDACLGCNVPAIHVARPQREVDVILVVDCEVKGHKKESEDFLLTLKCLQRQMEDNNMKFPKIDIDDLAEDPEQEYYLFEDPNDSDCPIVVWFTLYNIKFRSLLHPDRSEDYPPEKYGGVKFNDFDVTPDSDEYSTTDLQYSARDVDRLRELMRFNITEHVDVVKEAIAKKVALRRSR